MDSAIGRSNSPDTAFCLSTAPAEPGPIELGETPRCFRQVRIVFLRSLRREHAIEQSIAELVGQPMLQSVFLPQIVGIFARVCGRERVVGAGFAPDHLSIPFGQGC